mgnify:CR=1 FL=1
MLGLQQVDLTEDVGDFGGNFLEAPCAACTSVNDPAQPRSASRTDCVKRLEILGFRGCGKAGGSVPARGPQLRQVAWFDRVLGES